MLSLQLVVSVALLGVASSQVAPSTNIFLPPLQPSNPPSTQSTGAGKTQADRQQVAEVVRAVLQTLLAGGSNPQRNITEALVQTITLHIMNDLAAPQGQSPGQGSVTDSVPLPRAGQLEAVSISPEVNSQKGESVKGKNSVDPASNTSEQPPFVLPQNPGDQTQHKQQNLDWSQVCRLPAQQGMCRGFFPSYSYDVKTHACHRFIYGGCGGNDNRFITEAECLAACGSVQ